MRPGTRAGLNGATVLATAVLLGAAAGAQISKEWMQCSVSPVVDVMISGCSEIIRAGQDTPQRLAVAFNNRGVAYRLKGEYDRALEDCNASIRLDPSSATFYHNRGIIYRIKREFDRAIKEFDQAISLDGNFPAAYHNRALAYANKGEHDRALADFDTALRFNARDANALYGRGLARQRKGDIQAGTADIAAAKAINPYIAAEFQE